MTLIDNGIKPLTAFSVEPSKILDYLAQYTKVLEEAGESITNPSAYDTAFVALLKTADAEGLEGYHAANSRQPLFPEALGWIVTHQHVDGSWGEGGIPERLLSTLAAMVALHANGRRASDTRQAGLGMEFLWKCLNELKENIDTTILPVGFELLLSTLLDMCHQLSLDLPTEILSYFEGVRQEKLAKLRKQIKSQADIRHTSAVFSLEYLGGNFEVAPEIFVAANGSIGGSIAATAATFKYITDVKVKRKMLDFMLERRIVTNQLIDYTQTLPKPKILEAGWGTVAHFDMFELVWVLYNFRLCYLGGLNKALLSPELLRWLEEKQAQVAARWLPTGLPFSSFFFDDSDVTSCGWSVFEDLRHVLPNEAFFQTDLVTALKNYWHNDNYLVTYAFERDASTSANIHALEAYYKAGQLVEATKLLNFLAANQYPDGYWLDKWHISPYYSSCHAVIVLSQLGDLQGIQQIAERAVNWLLSARSIITDNNAGWGAHKITAEETAYALQALVFYARRWGWTTSITQAVQAGANYLREIYPQVTSQGQESYKYQPLWVGKNYYAPYLVVEAAVLSALILTEDLDI